MQHVADKVTATGPNHTITSHQQPLSAMSLDTTSQSSNGSPLSQKANLDPNASQVSESTLASGPARELTPPSSVASSQEQHDLDKLSREDVRHGDMPAPSPVTGKKRTASGEVKEVSRPQEETHFLNDHDHLRNGDTGSHTGNPNLGELSQQLRTKLTYAMVKVQNGWQRHSLDEIESIASQSPRSHLSGLTPARFQPIVSPRTVIAAGMRNNSNASSASDHSQHQQSSSAPLPPVESSLYQRKCLAPPAPIVSGSRRRPSSNAHLHINSSLKPPSKIARPAPTQRTPSQNAAMEADAVETLLFMSASPGNSGHFPSHLSTYSPISQTFSAQSSPLKTQFSLHERSYAKYSPRSSNQRARYEDQTSLIDRLLHGLDDDESEELDRAVKIMDQHHAAKLSTSA